MDGLYAENAGAIFCPDGIYEMLRAFHPKGVSSFHSSIKTVPYSFVEPGFEPLDLRSNKQQIMGDVNRS